MTATADPLTASDPRAAHWRRMKHASLAALVLCAGLFGVWGTAVPEDRVSVLSEWGLGLGIGVLLAWWCLFDGSLRGRRPTRIGLFGVMVLPHAGFPIYCLWSRGVRGLLVVLLVGGAVLASFVLGAVVAAVAMEL